VRAVRLLLFVAVLGAPIVAQDAPLPRLVAIGDVHGHIQGFTAILSAAGLIDADGHWAGGKATFVLTGDFMDRGDNVRAVMDRQMALEAEAKAAGGSVVTLLGNHEVMNLVGFTRDATPAIYAMFSDAQSVPRQQQEWDRYSQLAAARRDRGETPPPVFLQSREGWTAAHPVGYLEYREALDPDGKYGAWLRGKGMVAKVGDSIFMHAGIMPSRAPKTLDEMNERVKSEVARVDRFRARMLEKKLIVPSFTLNEMLQVASAEIDAANAIIRASNAGGPPADRSRIDVELLTEASELLKIDEWTALAVEGPLWYRGFSQIPDDPAGGPIAPLLERYGARRFVTGHTPTSDRRILARFGGRALLIDTGMAPVYQGRGSALEIVGGSLTGIYEDGRLPIAGTSPAGPPDASSNHASVWRNPSSRLTVGW